MSEKALTGIGTMEARADEAMADRAREHAIEARIASPEVQILNNDAEQAIYGETGYEMVLDPDTGEAVTRVVADPSDLDPGKLDDILHNPRFGKSEPTRERNRDAYVDQLENLMKPAEEGGDGLEIAQAKMVMELREKSGHEVGKLTGKFVAEGYDADTAHKKAYALYEKADAARRKLIKEGGAFTMDEYERLLKGEELYPAEDDERAPDTPDTPTDPEHVDIPEFWETELKDAQKEYARIYALRAQRGAGFGRRLKSEKYEEALQYAEARVARANDVIGAQVAAVLRARGIPEARILTLSAQGRIWRTGSIETRIQEERIALAEPKGRARKAFLDLWSRLGGKVIDRERKASGGKLVDFQAAKRKLAKFGLISLVGLPASAIGVVASPIFGAVGGGLLGLGAARAIGKGLAVGKIAKAASAPDVARKQGEAHMQEALARITADLDAGRFGTSDEDMSAATANAEKEVTRNRNRTVGSVAIAGAAGGLGALAADHFFGGEPKELRMKMNKDGFNTDLQTPEFKPPQGPDWTPHPTDNRLEWLHAQAEYGGAEVASTANLHYDEILRQAGFEMGGNGLGNGAGAYEWFMTPDGTMYTPAHPQFHGIVNYFHDVAKYLENTAASQG